MAENPEQSAADILRCLEDPIAGVPASLLQQASEENTATLANVALLTVATLWAASARGSSGQVFAFTGVVPIPSPPGVVKPTAAQCLFSNSSPAPAWIHIRLAVPDPSQGGPTLNTQLLVGRDGSITGSPASAYAVITGNQTEVFRVLPGERVYGAVITDAGVTVNVNVGMSYLTDTYAQAKNILSLILSGRF